MKCPNCGQETNDIICSCGYQFPQKSDPPSPVAAATVAPPAVYCSKCGAPGSGTFCQKCGAPLNQQAAPQIIIQNTQVQSAPVVVSNLISPKSKITALIICLFLGWAGIHRFYVGKIGTGILWLFTGGLFVFGWIIDAIVIACGGFKDSYGRRIIN